MSQYEDTVRKTLQWAREEFDDAVAQSRTISPMNGALIGRVAEIRMTAAAEVIKLCKDHIDTIARLKL